jgi:hypothetical protein
MPGAQIPTSVTRLESMLGYQAVSLTNFDSSALSAIAAGSKVEIAGAFFTFMVDETIEASTWTSIVTGNTAYIALIPAGTAGSQTVTASYTATAPVWSTSKQGWYASAGSSTRVIGRVYKAEATSQQIKEMLEPELHARRHGAEVFLTSGTFIVPSGVQVLYISGCAAGGNAYGPGGQGGGGGAEWALKKAFPVLPGSVLTVTIGAVGSNSSIGTFQLNCGGNGGVGAGGTGGALNMGTGAGGAGGSAQIPGNPGLQAGGASIQTAGYSGGGGGSYGSGASARGVSKIGGYGGGGVDSGAGGPAILIVEW